MMASPFKPARISGHVTAGYSGPIFYRITNYLKPNPPSKVLFDYLKFPGRNVLGINRIGRLSDSGALTEVSDYASYLDKDGNVDVEWSTPIRAVIKANYKEDWPEFSLHPVLLVSARLKSAVEKYDKDNHAFVAVDVEGPNGKQLFRAFVLVSDNSIDAVDYIASNIQPSKVYPNGTASWVQRIALPRDEFCYLWHRKVQGRHHFMDPKLGHVFSEEIVKELGDVLPKEFVFVPMGVVD
jgi:hypothetical protein